ncbi:MAG: deoxyribodipyrimidine photo-lyase [Pseudomonadota bacterium]
MSENSPAILWLRRDLRLSDHPAMTAALASGGPVIPVYIRDDLVDGLGAAPKWRLGLSIEAYSASLEALDSKLVLRSGNPVDVLKALIEETGATSVHWHRAYDPDSIARDKEVKTALKDARIEAQSHAGHLLFEPWTVQTGSGGFYKVYSPMWKAVRTRDVAAPLLAPSSLPAPLTWPESESLDSWALGSAMNRGAEVCQPYQRVGEEKALERLHQFTDAIIAGYDTQRDFPAIDGTSGLSENLSLGEISPRTCWHAGQRALADGKSGAETWLKELVWREFAYHLVYHTPHITSESWREGWEKFPWSEDDDSPDVLAWKQGRTGIAFVDAAMREMYVTGRMHNRARMIVGSYLTKHMMTHWRIGQKWFEECLTDWDPASNAMGWQWVAGSGPDATPYFRVFNPDTQLDKFDRDAAYRRAWIAEGHGSPSKSALSFYDAIPPSWALSPQDRVPDPIVGLSEGRTRALDAYAARDF